MRSGADPSWDRVARLAIALGAVARALWALFLHLPVDHVYSDAQSYVESAMRLAKWAAPVRFDAFYPPGTQVVLAVPLALIGADRDGLLAAAIVWTILSAITPLFVWRYTLLVLSRPAAALATVLCAAWPIHIAYTGYFMSETPGMAFLVLSLWLAERARRERGIMSGLGAGLAGGFAAVTRPAFVLNVLLGAVPLVRARALVRPAIALAAGVLLMLALAVVHNSLVVGQLSGISENSGLTFYLGHCDVHAVRTTRSDGITYVFATPVATQLDRGADVTFAERDIWDERFFYSEGLRCIANDGLSHARILLRNVFDMGLSTVPWPPSNDPGVREVVSLANILYVLALPFVVLGSVRLVRRRWPEGGGRGELMLLGQLALVLVTAVVFLGDPRFRTPYDVFGLALLGSLIADRFVVARSAAAASSHPDVRADDGVEQDGERVLGRSEPSREVDADQASAAESDRAPAVRADDDAAQHGRTLEGDEAVPAEELGRVRPRVHQVPPVGPAAVEPEITSDAQSVLAAGLASRNGDAPDRGAGDEDAAGVAPAGDRSGEEVHPSPFDER